MKSMQHGGGKDAALGREIQSKIGQQLRAMYDNVVDEGVPDRFADLLRQLDKSAPGDK
ncbi:MAG: NepR family anti-sigma factor [Pseudorhodoplanes sp.]